MDVKHLEYFITIVESRFNISKAAEALYISQPALTKYIKEFESAEHVQLFIRYKGRLVDLTPAGHLFYDKAKDVVKQYHKLMDQLHQPQGLIRGTVRLGIPSLVLTSLCLSIIPKFIKENLNINLKITVDGAQKLQELLLLQEIDLAFLIEPITHPNLAHTNIYTDQVAAVFNSNHRLAQATKPLSYKDLEHEKLCIFDESFLLHNQIIKNFHLAGITPNIFFKSKEWDLLASLCEEMDTVALLPHPIVKFCDKNATLPNPSGQGYQRGTIVSRPLDPKFLWTITLAKINNVYHNESINLTEQYFIKHFQSN